MIKRRNLMRTAVVAAALVALPGLSAHAANPVLKISLTKMPNVFKL